MEYEQWSLPRRRDYIKQLRDSGTKDYDSPLSFQGRMQTFPVYTVEIGFPCYRLSNGRTKSAQKEVIITKGLSEDFFSLDPDSGEALKEQDKILRSMVADAGLLKILREHEQSEHLILTNDGYIVNGNRRICAMRLLLEQDAEKYTRFQNVQVMFLPLCSEKDIKQLEGKLQVQPQGRAEYSWVDEAFLYRDMREQGMSDSEIANLYEKKINDVRDLIAMLEDAENYLTTRDQTQKYSKILKKEYAFRQLLKSRKKCGEDEPQKQLVTTISYLMLDDQDTTEGRLYESIPDALKYIDDIARNIIKDIPIENKSDKKEEKDGLDILGGPEDCQYAQVIATLQVDDNLDKAREVIRDTIEEMRLNDRERRDSAYCLRQIQAAYTKLQSSHSALDENADTTGMPDLLANIEGVINDIQEWLSNVSN